MNFKWVLTGGLRMEVIINDYAVALQNSIRDKNAKSDILRKNLFTLGNGVGQKIAEKYFLEEKTVETPMGEKHKGIQITSNPIVVVSTKDDYQFFGNGVASVFSNADRGFMDFAGVRGEEALSCPLRAVKLPDKDEVEAVIVAKSVLATGCTAISLAKRAAEKYNPQYLIIASVFYSEQGIADLQRACKNAEIFVVGAPDKLRTDGMLIPGFGNLDERLSESVG